MEKFFRIALIAALGAGTLWASACNDDAETPFEVEAQSGAELSEVDFAKSFPTVEQLRERLRLREDQIEPMHDLLGQMRQTMEQHRQQRAAGERLGHAPGRHQFQGMAQEILDEAQLEQFRAAMREFHHRVAAPHREAMQQRHLEHLSAALGLSDEQRAQIAEILGTDLASMRALHADGQGPTEEKMRAHHEAMRAKFAEILTPEQMEQLEHLHQQRLQERSKAGADH